MLEVKEPKNSRRVSISSDIPDSSSKDPGESEVLISYLYLYSANVQPTYYIAYLLFVCKRIPLKLNCS